MPRSDRTTLPTTRNEPDPTGEIPLAELEVGLRINRNDLEGSLETQADCFYEVSKQVALLTSLRDAAKQRVSELEADVDAHVRHDAEVAEEKITEKQIESEKRRDPGVKRGQAEFLRLNHKLALAVALKDAFVQRSYVLKDLCALHINSLYSSAEPNQRVVGRYREGLSDRAREGMASQRAERSRNANSR